MTRPIFFISDLHLSADRPDITKCFQAFMESDAMHANAVYILGDLFEYWLGDDDISDFTSHIATIIHNVSQRLPVYFIHGNRDFLLGEKFARRSGMQLLPEQTVIDLFGTSALICHGDEFCTRDEAYMRFRKKARGWWWPTLIKALPLSWRRKKAEAGRKASHNNKQMLSADIMDVTQHEVETAMCHHNVNLLIHGHTHRPNIHNFALQGQAACRIVLGDWYDQGSILTVTGQKFSLETRKFQS